MKKYEVRFTAYDNCEWKHRDGEMIVEANSEEEAKKIVRNKSDCREEYFADYVREII